MAVLLEAKQVNKTFGSGDSAVHALRGIDLTVEAGDFYCIMGPSGSGKSTLLFALAAMDTIDSGSVHFQGISLHEAPANDLADLRRQAMGFVFQDATMLANLDILDNILLPSYDAAAGDRPGLVAKAEAAMDRVGIGGLGVRSITEVSGGQLQRASICRAILHEPEILFGDEPTGALNSQATSEILDLFVQLNEAGMTILLVTHDAHVATRGKTVLFMQDGALESALSFDPACPFDDRLRQVNAKMLSLGI